MHRTARVTPVEERKVSGPGWGGRTGSSAPDCRPKRGLTQSLGDQLSLWQEPQWNADRRARFAKRALRRRVQQLTTRLSAFCFLVFFLFFLARAPSPILMHSAFSTARASDEGRFGGVVF